PSPAEFDFLTVARLTEEVGRLEQSGRTQIERVRGEIGAVLESAPVTTDSQIAVWFAKLTELDGCGWQEFERYWLRERAQWRVRGLKPLNVVFPVADFRIRTVIPHGRVHVLSANDLRPDCYLAVPEADRLADSGAAGAAVGPI